jgi:hypothetical protein
MSYSQKSNMEKAFLIEENIKERHIAKYLSYSIHKNKQKSNQFSEIGYIEIYKDSLVFHKFFEISINNVSYVKKTILNNHTIEDLRYYVHNFGLYKPKCYQESFFYENDFISPPPNFSKNKVGFSNKEWIVSVGVLNNKNTYNYTTSFKSRLFKFKCLGFLKNLKSRRLFKKLIKIINDGTK